MRQKKNVLALEVHLGTELHRRSTELTRAWLDRLLERLDVQPRRIFPAEALLNHIPEVLSAVSDYLCSDGERGLRAAGAGRVRQAGAAAPRAGLRHRRDPGRVRDPRRDPLQGAARGRPQLRAQGAAGLRDRGRRAPPPGADVDHRDHRHDLPRGGVPRPPRPGPPARRLRARPGARAAQPAGHGGDRPPPARRRAPEPASREKALRTLQQTLRRLKGVADDVQALAIAQGSEETAQGRRLSLRALVAETVEELQTMAGERGVRIEIQEPIPDVQVDATRVELALINLVGNAVKYSDPDEEDRWVRLGVQRDEEGFWRISVADNGLGIPEEMHDLIFEQFVRAHPGGGRRHRPRPRHRPGRHRADGGPHLARERRPATAPPSTSRWSTRRRRGRAEYGSCRHPRGVDLSSDWRIVRAISQGDQS